MAGSDFSETRETGGACEHCPLTEARVHLLKVEILFHNDNADGRTWPRDMFPFSTDPVTLQAIVWATDTEGDEVGRPYAFWPGCQPDNPYEYFPDDGFYCSHGRGAPGNGRIDFREARPDLHNPSVFGVPTLEVWRNHRLNSAVAVQVWPTDRWPHPQFAWHALRYVTNDPADDGSRAYWYETPSSLTGDSDSQGWTVTWRPPDAGLWPGTHRFAVAAQLCDDRVACPSDAPRRGSTERSNAERDAGCVLHVCVRDADIQAPDAAIQELAAQNLPHPPPDCDPAVVEWLRWMSIFLEVPYEIAGKWLGGKSTGGPTLSVPAQSAYQGYGFDCTGLPSTGRVILDQAWGSTYPEWRLSTHGQGNPLPGFPLYDRWNDWDWRDTRWQRTTGRFERFTRDVLGYVQPGDIIDTGTPGCERNHIRIVYRVLERVPADRPTDARVQIIEASSSEARKVRRKPEPLSQLLAPAQAGRNQPELLSRLVDAEPNQYGLWRPLASHPARPAWWT